MDLRTFAARLAAIRAQVRPDDPDSASKALKETVEFMKAEHKTFDTMARREADRILDGLIELGTQGAEKALPGMTEGPEKRSVTRAVAAAREDHFLAMDLVAIFERPPAIGGPAVSTARPVFLNGLQLALDFLFDARSSPTKGKVFFAKYGIATWAVDELLVAFDLAQRAFVNQAYSHIRTVHEVFDKLELFHRDAAWAEFWVDKGAEYPHWKELAPAEVRKKLGRVGHDPLYNFFSSMGAHMSFRGLQARGGMVSGREHPQNTFFIAGAPLEHELIVVNVLAIHAALAFAVKVARVFADKLNKDEVNQRLGTCAGEFRSMVFTTDVLRATARTGVDAEAFGRLLRVADGSDV